MGSMHSATGSRRRTSCSPRTRTVIAKNEPMRSRSAGESGTSSAASTGSRCSGRDGPQTAAVTCGCESTHANASAAIETPRSAASAASRSRPSKTRSATRCSYGSGRIVIREPSGKPAPRAYLPASQPPDERAVRHVVDPVLGAERQHRRLVLAVEQRVRVLDDRRPAVRERLLDPGRVVVAEPPRGDRALGEQRLERADRLGERRVRVGVVREVQVDPLDAEALEAALDVAPDPVGREAAVGRVARHRVEDLRRDEQALGPAVGAPAADVRLAAAAAVRVGRVEPADARVPAGVHDRARLLLVRALAEEGGRRADAAEVAAAEREALRPGHCCDCDSAVSSLRSSHRSWKYRRWISRPSTSTGVPCVPTTAPPITRSTTTKCRVRQPTMRSSHSIRHSASW